MDWVLDVDEFVTSQGGEPIKDNKLDPKEELLKDVFWLMVEDPVLWLHWSSAQQCQGVEPVHDLADDQSVGWEQDHLILGELSISLLR